LICKPGHVVGRFDQMNGSAVGETLAHGAFHLRMARVTDQDDLDPVLAVPSDLQVDLGDQRAGGIEDAQIASLRRAADLLRDAMGAEDQGCAIRDLIDAPR
jgi:hypothetical protein